LIIDEITGLPRRQLFKNTADYLERFPELDRIIPFYAADVSLEHLVSADERLRSLQSLWLQALEAIRDEGGPATDEQGVEPDEEPAEPVMPDPAVAGESFDAMLDELNVLFRTIESDDYEGARNIAEEIQESHPNTRIMVTRYTADIPRQEREQQKQWASNFANIVMHDLSNIVQLDGFIEFTCRWIPEELIANIGNHSGEALLFARSVPIFGALVVVYEELPNDMVKLHYLVRDNGNGMPLGDLMEDMAAVVAEDIERTSGRGLLTTVNLACRVPGGRVVMESIRDRIVFTTENQAGVFEKGVSDKQGFYIHTEMIFDKKAKATDEQGAEPDEKGVDIFKMLEEDLEPARKIISNAIFRKHKQLEAVLPPDEANFAKFDLMTDEMNVEEAAEAMGISEDKLLQMRMLVWVKLARMLRQEDLIVPAADVAVPTPVEAAVEIETAVNWELPDVPDDIKQMPLMDYIGRLSVRVRKACIALGVSTVGDALKYKPHEFLRFKNFGPTSMHELWDKMAARCLWPKRPATDEQGIEPAAVSGVEYATEDVVSAVDLMMSRLRDKREDEDIYWRITYDMQRLSDEQRRIIEKCYRRIANLGEDRIKIIGNRRRGSPDEPVISVECWRKGESEPMGEGHIRVPMNRDISRLRVLNALNMAVALASMPADLSAEDMEGHKLMRFIREQHEIITGKPLKLSDLLHTIRTIILNNLPEIAPEQIDDYERAMEAVLRAV
jgi:hypothetical protein